MIKRARLVVTARACTYSDRTVTVAYDGSGPIYRDVHEVDNLAEVELAVRAARHRLEGQDVLISPRVIGGRKPNGFDRWVSASHHLLQVHKEEACTQ